MLDLEKLVTLVLVSQYGSLAAAGERRGISGSAASQQLKSLEKELGVPLLQRRASSVKLTPAGAALAQEGEALLAHAEDVLRHVVAVGQARAGVMKIGTFASAARRVVLPAATHTARKFGGMDLRIVEIEPERAVPAVKAGDVDAALVHRYSFAPDYDVEGLRRLPVLSEAFRLAVARTDPLAQRGIAEVRHLHDARWIAPEPESGFQALLEFYGRTAGFEPVIRHRCDTYGMALDLVATGTGVALIPALAAEEHEGVVYIPLHGPPAFRQIDLVTREEHVGPAIELFAERVVQGALRLSTSESLTGQ